MVFNALANGPVLEYKETISAAEMATTQVEANHEPTTLLTLPAEIRNMIYRHVLISNGMLAIWKEIAVEEPALLRTCRQVRREARTLFFSENEFISYSHNREIGPILKFFQKHSLHFTYFSFNRGYHQDLEGPSKHDAEVEYIKTWYTGVWDVSPNRRFCSGGFGRRDRDYIGHRLWDIAKKLKAANMPWEDAKEVLDAAGELVMAERRGSGKDWKPELTITCCTGAKM
ncbi:hypothetical protein NA57DRAFT_60425 [Rhizodiscina lignyota]|uniref:F-box domain-containing protein n=1 Tax=Rhizodiscina lignyota TaxID=1504668 RepID=A0A9P4M280_9PEZI|nr:hypothetical protein NA57DRAFT_60425 [Rhizodiscina lignyota]